MAIAVAQQSLSPADAGRCLTREEFAAAQFQEPYIYERVLGRLLVMSPAGPEHRFVSRPFRRQLCGYWDRHPDLVDDVDIEGWVATSEDNDRLPDICVYLAGSSSSEVVPNRVPNLIFEFVSGNRSDQERDYVQKRQEYHQIGVREYVIVDRLKKEVLVLRWQPTDFEATVLTIDEAYTTPLLPGLAISIADAFARQD
jgi:Uma2 family endonuclease